MTSSISPVSDVGGAVNRFGGSSDVCHLAHDEYATMATLDRLQAALDGGTSLAFLTGNTLCLADPLRGQRSHDRRL